MNPQSNKNQPAPDFGEPSNVRLYYSFFGKPLRPDPWSPEDDAAAKDPAASKLCLRCLHPQTRTAQGWFCPNCGEPDCDNIYKPYLYISSIGALARRGVMGKSEKGFFKNLFLVLFSSLQYLFFAPIYWYWMICKAVGKPICDDIVPPPDLTDADSQEPPPPPPQPSPKQRAAALALMRVFTLCVIAVVSLLVAFVIVAAVTPTAAQLHAQILHENDSVVRTYLGSLLNEQQAYLQNTDYATYRNYSESDLLALRAQSPDMRLTARAKIHDMAQTNAKLLQQTERKLVQVSYWLLVNDTSSGMNRNLLEAIRDELTAVYHQRMADAEKFAHLDAALETSRFDNDATPIPVKH